MKAITKTDNSRHSTFYHSYKVDIQIIFGYFSSVVAISSQPSGDVNYSFWKSSLTPIPCLVSMSSESWVSVALWSSSIMAEVFLKSGMSLACQFYLNISTKSWLETACAWATFCWRWGFTIGWLGRTWSLHLGTLSFQVFFTREKLNFTKRAFLIFLPEGINKCDIWLVYTNTARLVVKILKLFTAIIKATALSHFGQRDCVFPITGN